MPSPTTVYLAPRQKKRLFARAKKRGTSFSGELRAAVEMYLEFPPDEDLRDLEAVAREANASLDRSNAKLDEAMVWRIVRRAHEVDVPLLHQLEVAPPVLLGGGAANVRRLIHAG